MTITTGEARLEIAEDDIVLPFQIEPFALRGRIVRLGSVVETIIGRHDYPLPVAQLLAETLALAAALAAALKYDGVFTLQTAGDGPVRLMVADVTSAGAMRGYAQFDARRLAALDGAAGPVASVPRLLGAGHLAFTVDQGPDTERYQGVVELVGATLTDCAHHYFRQSEQLQTGIKVAAGRAGGAEGRGGWRAGALMIQRVPPESAQGSAEGHAIDRPLTADQDEAEDGWRRALTLMGSATSAEIIDPRLPAWRLVDRLFLAEGVRIYRPQQLSHACRCSRERVTRVLRSLPRGEIDDLKVAGVITVTCEFCNASHVFDDVGLAAVLASG